MWPDISNALSVLACFLSLVAGIYAARSAIRVRELQDQIARLPVSRMKSLETSLIETRDALEAVANRVKMMRVRNAANHVPDRGEPDPYTNPDEWRKSMNRKLSHARK